LLTLRLPIFVALPFTEPDGEAELVEKTELDILDAGLAVNGELVREL